MILEVHYPVIYIYIYTYIYSIYIIIYIYILLQDSTVHVCRGQKLDPTVHIGEWSYQHESRIVSWPIEGFQIEVGYTMTMFHPLKTPNSMRTKQK